MLDLILKNAKVFLEDRFVDGVSVGVKDGRIAAVAAPDCMPQGKQEVDLEGQYLIPGTIDTHMHVRDPGHTERGNFYTETMAAAAGGVTTILEQPISVPPQHNVAILENRIARADAQCVVDFAFYGAAGGEFLEDIGQLAKDGRIVAYKTFLHAAPEGREQEFQGLTMADDDQLYHGMQELAKTGLFCAFHAENNDMISANIKRFRSEGKVSAEYHCLSRPTVAEVTSVERILNFAKETGARIEIAHVSCPEVMELLRQAKKDGMPVYVETCPHYLFLTEEDMLKYGPFAKCNPPVRSKAQAEKLWEYVNDGTVDYMGSDHSPFLLEEKTRGLKDIFAATAGFPGADLRLPLMLDAVADGRTTLEKVVELLSVNPAKCFGIYPTKGTISVGADADFTMFRMDRHMVVDKTKNYSHARDIAVPYEGKELKCAVTGTMVRGRMIMQDGVVDESAKAYGHLVVPVGRN